MRPRDGQALSRTASVANKDAETANEHQELEEPEAENAGISKKKICLSRTSTCMQSLIPILYWLPRYSLRENLCGDMIAGFTISVYHLSQGMAYALIAEVSPIHGIYMGIYQVLIYAIFGTSRHVSVGSMAVISLMTGSLVTRKLTDWGDTYDFENVQIVSAISVSVGVQQMVCRFLGFGLLSKICKTAMVSGFTAGCSLQIITLQLKTILGLEFTPYRLPGWMVLTWYQEAYDIRNANIASIVMTLIILVVLVINQWGIKPFVRKYTTIPVPTELILIITFTGLSSMFQDEVKDWRIRCIGSIPSGLPGINTPPLMLIGLVFADSVPISVIAYSITIAMAFLLANREYVIDPNQEFFALGAASALGSIFGCPPTAGSVSRSVMQKESGGKTRMTGFICAVILFTISMTIAHLLETLPNCVLASTILFAVSHTLFKALIYALKTNRESKEEGKLWLYTFVSTAFLDVIFGVLVGYSRIVNCIISDTQSSRREEDRSLASLRLVILQDNRDKGELAERNRIISEEKAFPSRNDPVERRNTHSLDKEK